MDRIFLRMMAALAALSMLLLSAVFPGEGSGAVAVAEEAQNPSGAETTKTTKQRLLKSGMKGEDVRWMQERLQELGYYTLEADGVFSADTKNAVKTFQDANGLKADGIAGTKTLTRLYSSEAIPAPQPVDVLAGEWPLLINKEYPVAETFVPANLVTLSEVCDAKLVKIKYAQTQGVAEAVDALIAMLEAAKKDGITNWQISAGYRSYQKQVTTLNAKINTYLERNKDWTKSRARKAALKSVAEPGCSEHHSGLAFDINVPKKSSFLGTPQCTWLHANCWDYGFIIRYQEGKEKLTGFIAEAWHIRYVGVDHARAIRDHGWCLEEYLEAMGALSGQGTEGPTEESEEELSADGDEDELETETFIVDDTM